MDDAVDALIARMDRLDDEFRELRDGVRRAIRLAGEDPEMALTRARKVMEYAIRDSFERRIGEPAGTRPLENLIQLLVKNGHLPTIIESYATSVRKLGNVGTHAFGERIGPDDVRQALVQLVRVLEWYFESERGIPLGAPSAAATVPVVAAPARPAAQPRAAALAIPEHTFLRSLDPVTFELRHEPTGATRVARHERITSAEDRAELARRRFALGRAAHSGLLAVRDVVDTADGVLIVRDAVVGPTLLDALRAAAGALPGYAAIFAAIAGALSAAHAAGVVHGALCPDDVILTAAGPIVVFPMSARGESLTGTPVYLAPEQLRGDAGRLDGRTDLYAFGVMLFEAATGRRPFEASDMASLLGRVLREEVAPSPRQFAPATDPRVEEVCARCLRARPEDRFPTAADVVDPLRAARDPTAAPPRRGLWARLRGR